MASMEEYTDMEDPMNPMLLINNVKDEAEDDCSPDDFQVRFDAFVNSEAGQVLTFDEISMKPKSNVSVVFVWDDDETFLLLTLMRKYKAQFLSRQCYKKQVWELISQDLKSSGVNVTGDQCLGRWKTLKSFAKKEGNRIMDNANYVTSKFHHEVSELMITLFQRDKDESFDMIQEPDPSIMLMKQREVIRSPSENDVDLKWRWDDSATGELLRLCMQYKQDFRGLPRQKKLVWGIITDAMNQKGFCVRSTQCEGKWKTLKAAFRRFQANKFISPDASIVKFYDEVSELYDIISTHKFSSDSDAGSVNSFGKKRRSSSTHLNESEEMENLMFINEAENSPILLEESDSNGANGMNIKKTGSTRKRKQAHPEARQNRKYSKDSSNNRSSLSPEMVYDVSDAEGGQNDLNGENEVNWTDNMTQKLLRIVNNHLSTFLTRESDLSMWQLFASRDMDSFGLHMTIEEFRDKWLELKMTYLETLEHSPDDVTSVPFYKELKDMLKDKVDEGNEISTCNENPSPLSSISSPSGEVENENINGNGIHANAIVNGGKVQTVDNSEVIRMLEEYRHERAEADEKLLSTMQQMHKQVMSAMSNMCDVMKSVLDKKMK